MNLLSQCWISPGSSLSPHSVFSSLQCPVLWWTVMTRPWPLSGHCTFSLNKQDTKLEMLWNITDSIHTNTDLSGQSQTCLCLVTEQNHIIQIKHIALISKTAHFMFHGLILTFSITKINNVLIINNLSLKPLILSSNSVE